MMSATYYKERSLHWIGLLYKKTLIRFVKFIDKIEDED